MYLDPNHWTLAKAQRFFDNVQRVLMEVSQTNKFTIEAQNYETTYGVPLAELAMAVETLLTECKERAQGIYCDPSNTKTFLGGQYPF
jgi:hypothetical protein